MMNIRNICTRDVHSCDVHTDLARAAALMYECDCGALPVVDPQDKVVGIITDRDIAIAAGTKNRPASQISVGEVMARAVHACRPEDDVRTALRTMAQNKVRRLPVVDEEGRLQGILSINDVILNANGREIPQQEVMNTLRAICEHYREQRRQVARKAAV